MKKIDYQLLVGKTEEQKKVIQYFLNSGCLGSLTTIRDDEYDKMIIVKVNSLSLKERAMEKIGLDEEQLKEIPPICLYGFEFENTYKKVGSDNLLRSSKYSVAWLFFSDTQIYLYKYIMDMTSDNVSERTLEYFYKDITCFSTSTESIEMVGFSGCLRQVGVKSSRTYSSFSIVVPGDSFKCSTTGVSNVENSVNGMKQKLREKKIFN